MKNVNEMIKAFCAFNEIEMTEEEMDDYNCAIRCGPCAHCGFYLSPEERAEMHNEEE